MMQVEDWDENLNLQKTWGDAAAMENLGVKLGEGGINTLPRMLDQHLDQLLWRRYIENRFY